jgi:RNA polymerase sigma-70 factor (ECF subfamily)
MRAIDTYQDDTDIRAWLLTILRRTHIDQRRAETPRPTQLSLDETLLGGLTVDGQTPGNHDSQWDEPEELLNRFEDEAIVAVLRMIPDDIRWTLLLVDIEQMAHADAAVVLDVAVGTIKSRLHRGRAMLRDRLYELAMERGWVPARSGRHE